jgi:hypothetical protein
VGIEEFETIVRSFTRKLALTPAFTIAPLAQAQYNTTEGLRSTVSALADWEQAGVDKWTKLLQGLIDDIPKQSAVIFLVDALEQCSPETPGRLLKFMAARMKASPNVQLVCSSQQHMQVGRWLDNDLFYAPELQPDMTRPDMEGLIKAVINARRPEHYREGESVFCKFDCNSSKDLF